MKLLPLVTSELVNLAAEWLGQRENFQWLDFGNGRQVVTPALLRIMAQRDTHLMRVYTADDDVTPIGMVALNNVDRVFGTATLWGLAGAKSFHVRGYGSVATSTFLAYAFREHGLHSVNTWVVDGKPSRRVIERVGFRYVGWQRRCHVIDGRAHDRLLYDLLADELRPYDEVRVQRAATARGASWRDPNGRVPGHCTATDGEAVR